MLIIIHELTNDTYYLTLQTRNYDGQCMHKSKKYLHMNAECSLFKSMLYKFTDMRCQHNSIPSLYDATFRINH